MNTAVSDFSAHRRLRMAGFLVVIAVIAALLSVAGGSSRASADGGTASVSGAVTSAAAPFDHLSGVGVQITSEDGSYFDAADTADDGTYELNQIPAGSYTLDFQPTEVSNFVEQCWQDVPCNGESQTYFTVTDGEVLTGYDAQLAPGASISGTVDGADAPGVGDPDVNVSVEDAAGDSGFASPDADGNYSITGLPAGDYTVDFQPFDGGTYLEQWWNDQPTEATAQTVSVAAGAAVSGIDATLAVGATVRGTVTTADGPIAGVTVSALISNSIVGQATSASDGTYTITGLPASDDYTALFQAPHGQNYATQYWDDESTAATATDFSVSASSTITGIDATLAPGASISGVIYAPGTPKVGESRAQVPIYSASGGGPVFYGRTNKQGHYKVIGLPAGSYTVGVLPQFGDDAAVEWWGGSFTQTGAEVLTLGAGQAATHISQQLIVGSTISGTVVSAADSSTPLANVDVTLWPSDQVYGDNDIPPYERQSDSDGNYSFANIGPGKYTLEFSPEDPNFIGQWWNDKPTQAKATWLVVKKNIDVSGIDASLAPTVIVPGSPTITGNARVGATLTAHHGTWKPNNMTFTYQWLSNGTEISGATASTYVPTVADLGAVLTLAVTGTTTDVGSQGLSETVTSPPTAAVTAAR